jgi:acyl carrier protein
MTREEIVAALIGKLTGSYTIKKEIGASSDVMGLELDSLDVMNYVVYLEDEFGLKIADEDIAAGGILVIENTAAQILQLSGRG